MPDRNPAMPLNDMEKVLRAAKDRPLSCAFGNLKNQAALLLDPRATPSIVLRQLQANLPEVKELSHGKALRDPDDPKHLQLAVNRGSAGIAKRLTKAVHGTGLRKVSILVEGQVLESAESEEPEEEYAEIGTGTSGSSAGSATPPSSTASPTAAAPTAATPQPNNPARDMLGDITRAAQALAAAGIAPDQKAALGTQLRDARNSAMSGDLGTARRQVVAVDQAMAAAPTSPASGWASATTRTGGSAGRAGIALGRGGPPPPGRRRVPRRPFKASTSRRRRSRRSTISRMRCRPRRGTSRPRRD